MSRIIQTQHEGKGILFVDLSDIEEDELKETVGKLLDFLRKSGKQNHLMLTDVTNSFIFGPRLEYAKQAMKEVRPYTKRRAMIGLGHSKRILLRAANLFAGGTPTLVFTTKNEALDYLVQ